jgi:hypothetical protein
VADLRLADRVAGLQEEVLLLLLKRKGIAAQREAVRAALRGRSVRTTIEALCLNRSPEQSGRHKDPLRTPNAEPSISAPTGGIPAISPASDGPHLQATFGKANATSSDPFAPSSVDVAAEHEKPKSKPPTSAGPPKSGERGPVLQSTEPLRTSAFRRVVNRIVSRLRWLWR